MLSHFLTFSFFVQGMLKFTLTVIIETARDIKRDSPRMAVLHSLYQLLGALSFLLSVCVCVCVCVLLVQSNANFPHHWP